MAVRVSAVAFSVWFLFAGAQSQVTRSHSHARNDQGFWYVRGANPQPLSREVRAAGLNYIQAVEHERKAILAWAMSRSSNSNAKQEMDDANEATTSQLSQLKVARRAAGDKDFTDVLFYFSTVANMDAMATRLCAEGTKAQSICDENLSKFVGCRSWLKESAETGTFQDNWHPECYGEWSKRNEVNDN